MNGSSEGDEEAEDGEDGSGECMDSKSQPLSKLPLVSDRGEVDRIVEVGFKADDSLVFDYEKMHY